MPDETWKQIYVHIIRVSAVEKGGGNLNVTLWDQVDPSDDFYLKINIPFSFAQNSTPHQV